MEFRVLGPLEVELEGALVPLAGSKQRSLLALLLLARGQPVSVDRLVDAIWSGAPPPTAQKSVQVSVSALRKALGDGRIATRGRSYGLVVEHGELDLDRFDELVAAAAAAPPTEAAASLRAALALVRGPPLADVALEPWAAPEVARLEHRVLDATAARIEADLALGRHREVVPELEALVAAHPFHEHLLELLLLALYRSGRQADALAAYRRGGGHLRDELGLEPGPPLQELERRILTQDPALAAPRPSPPAGRRRAGWKVVGGAVAVVVAAAAALTVAFGREGDATLDSLPAGVAVLDAADGRLIAHVPLAEIAQPAESVVGGGGLWVWNLSPFSLVEIDPSTGAIARRVGSPFGGDAGWYLPDDRGVWFTGDTELVRIDSEEGRPGARFPLLRDRHRFGLVGVVECDGSLWVASNPESEVLRVDPVSGAILAHVSVDWPWALACGDGGLWTTSLRNGVQRIDPATNRVVATAPVPTPTVNVVVGGGFAWSSNEARGTVSKVAPDGRIVATYETGDGARALSFADDTLWVGNTDVGTVTGIDAASGEERTFRFGHPVQTVAALGHTLLVVLADGLAYDDRIHALEGDVATFLVPIWVFDPVDPALAQTPWALLMERATCATLMAPSSGGGPLQPDLAAAPPTVSADGRTYTFRVRPGARFAPPSTDTVTAEAVRFSIERALSPALGEYRPGVALLHDLVGIEPFLAGTASSIAGIEVHGDAISFTTRYPVPGLPERLSRPFFCTVPTSTPIVQDGVAHLPPPSAGPYYVSEHENGEYATLLRNPSYNGPRTPGLDAIAFREGVAPEDAVGRVEAGDWDGAILDDGLLAPDGLAARRAAAGAGVRYEVLEDAATGDTELYALLSMRLGCDDVDGALDLATLCLRQP